MNRCFVLYLGQTSKDDENCSNVQDPDPFLFSGHGISKHERVRRGKRRVQSWLKENWINGKPE